MARSQHTRDFPPQGNSSTVKLTAGLLSDNVPTSFSNMEWCFQENSDYSSMHRKRSLHRGMEMQHTSDGGQDNSKSAESRSEEEAGGQGSMNRNAEEEQPLERKRRGFAIQIKNNDPIIFDDDSVSTLTHYDRRSSRKESGDLSDMLGPFQHGFTSRILAAEASANRIQEGEALVYNAPSDTEPLEHDSDDKKVNPAVSRQQKLSRAKQRCYGKIKENPSSDSVSASVRSARSESIAQRVAMFEKPVNQNAPPAVNKPIQAKKKTFAAAPQVNHHTDQSTQDRPKSKRPSLKTCLKNGTSDRSSRSIASILKNPTSDRSEKSARSVTFLDEDIELGSHSFSPAHDIPASESNLSASECKRSLSLKYKKSRVSKEERKLKHLKNRKRGSRSTSSRSKMESLPGCPFEFNLEKFGLSGFSFSNFDMVNFDISMLLGAFDCLGRDKRYDLTPSFDDEDDEGENGEKKEEHKGEILGREIATELVEFPQPRWNKGVVSTE